MAPCPDGFLLSQLLADELPAGDRAPLETHVEQCTVCQQVLERLTDDPGLRRRVPLTTPGRGAILDLREADSQPISETLTGSHRAGTYAPAELCRMLGPSSEPGSLGRLGDYEILELLGSGGMGAVFRARDRRLQRDVALKVLMPHLTASSDARRRFEREARSAAAVRHENVVAVYDVGQFNGMPYLVMGCVAGASLQERLRRGPPFAVDDVVRIGREVLAGLAAAHARGLVHRDIKPANILMEAGNRRVRVSDFGLARAVDDTSLTRSGEVAGTPLYMSPEQADGLPVDARSDLFSLGSVLYALCTGRPPFEADSTPAILKRICEQNPVPARERNPAVPVWLDAVILRLLAKQPAQRFPSAAEAAEALARSGAEPAAMRRRSRWPAVLGLGLLSGAVGVVLWVAGLFRPAPDTSLAVPGPLATSSLSLLPAGGSIVPAQKPQVGGGGFPFDRRGLKTRPQVSRDGNRAVVPCGAAVTIFDVASGKALRTLDSPSDEVRDAALSPDGRRLAAYARHPGKLRVWNLDGDKVLYTRDTPNLVHLYPVFSPDGRWLVIGESRPVSRLRVLDAFTGKEVKVLSTVTTGSGQFDPTGRRFAATCLGDRDDRGPDQDKVTVWDASDWREIATLEHPPDPTSDYPWGFVQFSPSGKYLAVAGKSGIAVWQADTLKPVATLKVPCQVWFDFLSDDQTLLVLGSGALRSDGFAPVHEFTRYDLTGRKQGVFTVKGPRDYLYVNLDPAREYLWLVHYETGTRLRIFEPGTGRELLPGGQAAPPSLP